MSKLSKHEAAFILYDSGVNQKEIARILEVTEKTISTWKVKYAWEERTISYSIGKKTAEDNALETLAHQTRIIKLISRRLAENVDEDSDLETLRSALIPKGEIDAVQKLFTTIKRKELEWGDKVRILREFCAWLKNEDLTLAQSVVEHVDVYLNEERK
ncbi:MAG: helix-turn-helix domain-containing protein [Desulfotomaculaceae bacterium]